MKSLFACSPMLLLPLLAACGVEVDAVLEDQGNATLFVLEGPQGVGIEPRLVDNHDWEGDWAPHLRIVNARGADTPIDVIVNGQLFPSMTAIGPGEMSAPPDWTYWELNGPDTYALEVQESGVALTPPISQVMNAGEAWTLVFSDGGSPQAQLFRDAQTSGSSGMARMKVINGTANAVDVDADGTPVVSNLSPFSESTAVELPAGDATFLVQP